MNLRIRSWVELVVMHSPLAQEILAYATGLKLDIVDLLTASVEPPKGQSKKHK